MEHGYTDRPQRHDLTALLEELGEKRGGHTEGECNVVDLNDISQEELSEDMAKRRVEAHEDLDAAGQFLLVTLPDAPGEHEPGDQMLMKVIGALEGQALDVLIENLMLASIEGHVRAIGMSAAQNGN